MDLFSASRTTFSLAISLDKTKIMYSPALGQPYIPLTICVSGKDLGIVETLGYLASTLSQDRTMDDEISMHIQKAAEALGRFEKPLWADRYINGSSEISVYKTCVLITLRYTAETWTVFCT